MAKRNVCILESFFSLGATEEGRWQRSCSIAALILLIRDRSRALAVCLCLLKPVSRGFLRRLLFLFRASLLPIFFRSREFSTTILVWYSREWSLLSNLGVQWTERDWPSYLEFVFKPRNALSLSRSNWPNFLLTSRAVCQPKWNWPPFTRSVECALNEDPNLQSEGVDSRIELQRRSSGFQLWNQIICNQISGHKNETTLLRSTVEKNSNRGTKGSQCYAPYLLSTWEVIHWNNWTKSRQGRSISRTSKKSSMVDRKKLSSILCLTVSKRIQTFLGLCTSADFNTKRTQSLMI